MCIIPGLLWRKYFCLSFVYILVRNGKSSEIHLWCLSYTKVLFDWIQIIFSVSQRFSRTSLFRECSGTKEQFPPLLFTADSNVGQKRALIFFRLLLFQFSISVGCLLWMIHSLIPISLEALDPPSWSNVLLATERAWAIFLGKRETMVWCLWE